MRVFQNRFPADHYSRDLKLFLRSQAYPARQRGADLPWWGKKLFTEEKGFRVLVVAQDSLVPDAGSIVFHVQLMPLMSDKADFEKFEELLHKGRSFSTGWDKVRQQLVKWNIDFDFLYITDARKVYKLGSREDFDTARSKALLEAEIEFCNPDLVILLGKSPLRLLDKDKGREYASIVERGETIIVHEKKCVVSPYLIGQGRTQPGFEKRLERATKLIKREISAARRGLK